MIGKPSMALFIMLSCIFAFALCHSDSSEQHRPFMNADGPHLDDRRPSFLKNVPYRFVARFSDIAYADLPHPERMFKFENLTKIYLTTTNNKTVAVLPATEYQDIYVYGFYGLADVHIQMCPGGEMVYGGMAARGWNMIALDFPHLIQLSKCANFSMKTDRPTLLIKGFGSFNILKEDHYIPFKHFAPRKTSYTVQNLLIGFLILLCLCGNNERRAGARNVNH